MTEIITCKTVFEFGVKILNTCSSEDKAQLTLECNKLYNDGKISMGNPQNIPKLPDIPARPKNIKLINPKKVSKRGGGGTLKNRIALIHSFCHIESYAIDLSWDILLRFGPIYDETYKPNNNIIQYYKIYEQLNDIISIISNDNNNNNELNGNNIPYPHNYGIKLPNEFYIDWLRIASEEAYHFKIWNKRLIELGSYYGEYSCHDSLWESALITNNDILARLAIVHIVLEGRGLDVAPSSMNKLKKSGDIKSLSLLNIIFKDEITHVKSGLYWFKYICNILNKNSINEFKNIVKHKFNGKLKPPFNIDARNKAGLTQEWYLSLTS